MDIKKGDENPQSFYYFKHLVVVRRVSHSEKEENVDKLNLKLYTTCLEWKLSVLGE